MTFKPLIEILERALREAQNKDLAIAYSDLDRVKTETPGIYAVLSERDQRKVAAIRAYARALGLEIDLYYDRRDEQLKAKVISDAMQQDRDTAEEFISRLEQKTDAEVFKQKVREKINEYALYGRMRVLDNLEPGWKSLLKIIAREEGYCIEEATDGLAPAGRVEFYIKDIEVVPGIPKNAGIKPRTLGSGDEIDFNPYDS